MCLPPLYTTPCFCLVSYTLLLLAASPSRAEVIQKRFARSYSHLEGDVRWRRLYSAMQYFLTIDASGKVRGTRSYCTNSIFQVYSVSVGVVAMHSAGSGLYLAMDRKGKVYGEEDYGPNCRFRERIEENGYNSYSSERWSHRRRPMYVALRGNGWVKMGRRTRHTHRSAHFLPFPM
ncbi:hypothetical protein XENTR_v10001440 [Xenopus tropicalis]|uniref:Fibroblast growth factor n=1 Tax=Xenopus tropicalis TaxID=8364 RepID=B7UC02_XENTR|nr:fibroblast growth factor 22 precursor [Xenopus tropicalis]ACK58689.1 fibroblast growth factor 22 [Xenopus tropicalis]KAE8632122.1 hypothetical protein XENTR_v10001440 [Xenopus tropicalis]|eukprot:NP_001137396.1 fibroblast growth factor 22 precursor [Xenopus tropicalis]